MATFPDQLSSTFKDFFQSLQAATPKSSATAARAKVPCCSWDPVFGKHSNIAGWSPSIILMLFPHTKAGYKWEILGVDMVLDGNGYQLQSICYDLLQWPEQIIDLLTSKMLCQEKKFECLIDLRTPGCSPGKKYADWKMVSQTREVQRWTNVVILQQTHSKVVKGSP